MVRLMTQFTDTVWFIIMVMLAVSGSRLFGLILELLIVWVICRFKVSV